MDARCWAGGGALASAGILFVLYPAIRPFSSENGLEGAAAFGSSHWILAHMLAMVGFALPAVGIVCWYASGRWSGVSRVRVDALGDLARSMA